MPIHKKLAARRKKRVAADKFVVGERLTKAGRERGRRRRTMRKVEKVFKKGGKISTQRPKKGSKEQYKLTAEHKKALGMKQKIRKGAKEVTLTKGGAYAKYEKKSKAAKSFRSAFKSKCAEGAKSFSWDGRSYSCAKAGPAKKAAKPAAKTGAKLTLIQKAEKAGLVKKAPAPKGKKRTAYEMISGGKTAAQHREERKAKRRSR